MYCLRNRDSPGITAKTPPQKMCYFVCLLSFSAEMRGEASVSEQTCFCWGTKAGADFTHTAIHVDALSLDCGTVFPRSSLNR